MTNPNDAVGTNGAYEGRTSVNAFNDVMGGLTRGVLSGWACSPSSGMTIQLGGDGTSRDVAIAEDNAGNKTSINNISEAPINVTLSAAPATGSRIDAIVAYVDNPPQGDAAQVDNFAACGLIAVSGTAASTPVVPTDGIIRTAITGDGANGATAYYVILATVLVGTNVSTIGSGVITQGAKAQSQVEIPNTSITQGKIDFSSFHASAPVSLGWSGTNTQSYTAPGFGIVMIQTAVTAGKSITVSINGTNVAQAQAPGSSYTWIPITVLVTAGDVVKATSSDSGSAAQIQSTLCKFIRLA